MDKQINRFDKKYFFESFNSPVPPVRPSLDLPRQLIRYGAPGTGKSHGVKNITDRYEERTVRTTFHPDSDYSTFVGAYKPVMHNPNERILSATELESELRKMKTDGVTYPVHKFSAKYWKSLQGLSSDVVKTILSRCDFGDNYYSEVQKGMAAGVAISQNNNSSESKIIYKYVPQAFLKAYVAAWKIQDEPEFLVIEEINRGNCAQIFGDLFQLLDRNDAGQSDYPIIPDKDIQQYLQDEFAGVEDIPARIKSGEEMLLPGNLYIWATMNTSDQSLFPIDSAFKRRWDWQYVPISKGHNQDGSEMRWSISVNSKKYDWWSFLQKINEKIGATTNSEDKKLGFFFCKAVDGEISAETFVGKVVFYLWNDVFKDYGFEDAIFDDEDGKLTYDKFYGTDSTGKTIIVEDKVERFLDNLGVEIVSNEDDTEDDVFEEESEEEVWVSDTNSPYKVTFPDGTVICESTGWETFVSTLRKIGIEKALPYGEKYSRMKKTLPLITDKKIEDQGTYKYFPVDGYYVLKGTDSQHRLLNKMNVELGLGLVII